MPSYLVNVGVVLETTVAAGTVVAQTVALGSLDQGVPGSPGEGVPTGGTAGQVLTKDSGTDFDTSWQPPAGGGTVDTVAPGTGIDVDATDPANPIVSVESTIATDAEVAAAVAAEAATRAAADTALDGRVDALELAPPLHAASHGDGGSDEVSITGEQVTAGTVAEARIAAALARLASPVFTGIPAAPTAANGTNTTQLATTAFVQAAIALLINAAPGALDTLDELAAALGDDPNFATTVTNALAGKQPLDADLTAIAALTTVAFGRSLLEATDAAALRSLADVPSNAQAVLDTIIDAKGDLIVGTAADTPARLAVGTDDQVLTADSTQAGGVRWADPSGGPGGGTVETIVEGDGIDVDDTDPANPVVAVQPEILAAARLYLFANYT